MVGTEKGRVFLSARKELQADFQKFCSEYLRQRGLLPYRGWCSSCANRDPRCARRGCGSGGTAALSVRGAERCSK